MFHSSANILKQGKSDGKAEAVKVDEVAEEA